MLILCLILFSTPAFAADWYEIGHKAYVDRSSIKFQNGYVKAWTKILNNGNFDPIDGKKVHFYMSYDTYDCENRRVKTETITAYGLNGNALATDSTYNSWQNVIPDSNAEGWLVMVCGLSRLQK